MPTGQGVPSLQPPRPVAPGRSLLILQNPGRGSRNYLQGIIAALGRLRIRHCVLEIQEVWASQKNDMPGLIGRMNQILVQQRVGAVLGYGFNGVSDFALDPPLPKLSTIRSFFEIRGIVQLMLWLDHPHWHADFVGLHPEMQGMFRSSNCVHLLKSAAHAAEMERILGWPNCWELPAGVEPDQFPVSPGSPLMPDSAAPEYDLVAICSESPQLTGYLKDFAELDDPDPAAVRTVIAGEIAPRLEQLWNQEIPEGLRPEITALGKRWIAYKQAEPFAAAIRFWPRLVDEFPGAAWYLTLSYPTYMKTLRLLWQFREWERRFYLAYLARYFRVGVFGGDWSALGLGPGGWVDFLKQSAFYARGKVAINITDGHDEEGLTMKPFEIAASGVPMVHYRTHGLTDCFAAGTEVEIFKTPREAREQLAALVKDGDRRKNMAEAARARVLRDHTWDRRVEQMLAIARLPIEAFQM